MSEAKYGSIHGNAPGTRAEGKGDRRALIYRTTTALLLAGILLFQLNMAWTRPHSENSSSRQDLYSRSELSFLALIDRAAANDTSFPPSMSTEALFHRYGFATTMSVTTHIKLTPQSYELHLVDAKQPSDVLATSVLVPSRLDRCSRPLDILAPVVHLVDSAAPINSTLVGNIALAPLGLLAENCRAIALAEAHNMAMLLFYASASSDNVDHGNISICPSYEVPLDLTPGYAATAGAPRLSLAAAEALQGLTLPLGHIASASGLDILTHLRSSSNVLLRVSRRCNHRVLAQHRVHATVEGTHPTKDMVVLSTTTSSSTPQSANSPLAKVLPALRALLNTGWTPYRTIQLVASDLEGGLSADGDDNPTFHVHLAHTAPRTMPTATQLLPLHDTFTHMTWHHVVTTSSSHLRQSITPNKDIGIVATQSADKFRQTARIDLYAHDGATTTTNNPPDLYSVKLWATLGLRAATQPLYRLALVAPLRLITSSASSFCSSTKHALMQTSIDELVAAAATQGRELDDMSAGAIQLWNAKWMALEALLAKHNEAPSSCMDDAAADNMSGLVKELVASLLH
ncbi:hypothetical protein H257_00495 [Aphanomyces astaci]|uniref:Uncharacterized protein n=2 Tax=Aphanomyces astaci TaxID=112090 RepID=W4HCW5_APHAT|nr:hypothetical protein H257_00495 [Aphanomyces astaci]ETV89119.1 hypothetical protein H257_00495 [Aphanomyces astaci]|eukprot:XP_009821519.1 hypothetical protein H257_00495 [Aphanomyces astaci]